MKIPVWIGVGMLLAGSAGAQTSVTTRTPTLACDRLLAAGGSVDPYDVIAAYRDLVGAPDVPTSFIQALADSASPFEVSARGVSEQFVVADALKQIQSAIGSLAGEPQLVGQLRSHLSEVLQARRMADRAARRAAFPITLVAEHSLELSFAIDQALLSDKGDTVFIASAGEGLLGRWDATRGWVTGERFPVEAGKHYRLALSPFAPELMLSPCYGRVRSFTEKLEDGAPFDGPWGESFAFSPDGRYLAVNGTYIRQVWRVDASGRAGLAGAKRPLLQFDGAPVERFTGDSSHVVVRDAHPRTLVFRPVGGGKGVPLVYGDRDEPLKDIGDPDGEPEKLSFDFNSVNDHVAIGHAYTPEIQIWNWKTEKHVLNLDTRPVGGVGYRSITYSPDGHFVLALAGNGDKLRCLAVWDAHTGELEAFVPMMAGGPVDEIVVSKDSKTVLTYGPALGGATTNLKVWKFRPLEDEPGSRRAAPR